MLRGRGSIVLGKLPSPPFSISTDELQSVESVLRMNEIRTGIEVEGIALACQRRTDADLKNLETIKAASMVSKFGHGNLDSGPLVYV